MRPIVSKSLRKTCHSKVAKKGEAGFLKKNLWWRSRRIGPTDMGEIWSVWTLWLTCREVDRSILLPKCVRLSPSHEDCHWIERRWKRSDRQIYTNQIQKKTESIEVSLNKFSKIRNLRCLSNNVSPRDFFRCTCVCICIYIYYIYI